MTNNPLIQALDQAADNLKAVRYTSTDPKELALSLQQVARELAYHMGHSDLRKQNEDGSRRSWRTGHTPSLDKPKVLVTASE